MALQTLSSCFPVELSEAHVPEVASLYGRCADYFIFQDGVAPDVADAHALFTDVPPEKNARDQTVLGWRCDEELSAVGAILRDYPRDGTWYLGFMIVDADLRGRGLGRLMYAAIEQWAAGRGATEIRLAVLEENRLGESFWRSVGFGEVRRVGPDVFKARSHRRIELSRPVLLRRGTA